MIRLRFAHGGTVIYFFLAATPEQHMAYLLPGVLGQWKPLRASDHHRLSSSGSSGAISKHITFTRHLVICTRQVANPNKSYERYVSFWCLFSVLYRRKA